MILIEYAIKEIYTTYALIVASAVAFVIAGLLLVIKKDTALVDKTIYFKNPELFCLLYGLIEIIFGVSAIVLSLIGIFNISNIVIMFVGAGLIIVLVIAILIFKIAFKKRVKNA